MKVQTISIGCDHAGFPYKEAILRLLKKRGIEVHDFGTSSPDSVDYPDFVHPAANEVETGKADLGIIMCGSGNGVAMTANKHPGIRAAVCWKTELAALARQHNNANMIAIPVRFVSKRMALAMVRTFLDTNFEGGRHARRVGKIPCGGKTPAGLETLPTLNE
ncbi:MAG TPA: ribose 5-phosphate isomerase B [Bacteroidetes bacterium]|nr:ribose 5-phosphate isomerase B [Bacteroidota bacterium]